MLTVLASQSHKEGVTFEHSPIKLDYQVKCTRALIIVLNITGLTDVSLIIIENLELFLFLSDTVIDIAFPQDLIHTFLKLP